MCPLLVLSRGGENYWAWEKADLALHPNAGAPSSEPFSKQENTEMEESEMDGKQKLEREDVCPTDSPVAASLTD
ncbi:hypothetical protein GCM10008020_42520 [Massilia psychrophila]|uniref:Uncharacterized protein n=1 Tax=Pseudoalteromonas gelatinilytica TaxID=1703256 RepID=A0ABQ1UEE7_9GAMM|nr:hypothetical protein GCM10008020_42520 [Massilia psychrophila]GGF15778.1 hypothetical protein GCM10008027_45660 [Pseudoalteromonas profundi]